MIDVDHRSMIVAGVVFLIARNSFLPRLQADKHLRWDYDYIERGDGSDPFAFDYDLSPMNTHGGVAATAAALEDGGDARANDAWAVGSSSSVSSSGSLSPIDGGYSSIWEGETLASQSDNDVVDVVINGLGHHPRR